MSIVNAEIWTKDKIFTRVRKDLDLEAETFFRDDLMTEALNSAITDCEQLVIDEYSDYLLQYKDFDMAANQDTLILPDNIYQMRVRWLQFRRDGFTDVSGAPTFVSTAEAYKVKKMQFEDVQFVARRDPYRYRIVNFEDEDPKILIFPPFRGEDSGTARLRMWYIRHFKRLFNDSDVTDVPVPEYLLAHLRVSIMEKEGNPMLQLEMQKLADQTVRLQKTLKFLSDDEEDTLMIPTLESLGEFGDNTVFDVVRS